MKRLMSFSRLLVVLNCLTFPLFFSDLISHLVLTREALLEGEVWRLLTYMFMHAGVIHLAFNMMALWDLGAFLELLIGWKRVAFVYFTSGFAGGLWALHWLSDQPLVGASAAIFGLLGAISYLVVNSKRLGLPARILPSRADLMKVLVLNGVISLLPFVSLAGHFGGLVMGYLVTAILLRRKSAHVASAEPAPENT